MKFMKRPTVEELQLLSRFENLRKVLLSPERAPLLDKPLADWAFPSDRRLPFVLLGRTLRDLLNTPFMELAATPGIGQRKIRSLVELLNRAATCDPHVVVGTLAAPAPQTPAEPESFAPGEVSEVLWDQWRRTVLEHQLGQEPLGRLAPSLRHLSRVIWSTPMGTYAELSLSQIRQLRNHGAKRLAAIVEVFYHVHRMLRNVGPRDPLAVRILPHWIEAADRWANQMLLANTLPTGEAIREHLIRPLLEQLRIDADGHVVMLAESRVGLAGTASSVRQLSRVMGLTRARLYQLLNGISDIMKVRWPSGRFVLNGLRTHFAALAEPSLAASDLHEFHAAVELFFPSPRHGVLADTPGGASRGRCDGEMPSPHLEQQPRQLPVGESAPAHPVSPPASHAPLVSLHTAD